MPEKEKIYPRKLYQHFKGNVYVVLGFGKAMPEEVNKVILSNCDPKKDEIIIVNEEGFYEMKGDTPKFQLISP